MLSIRSLVLLLLLSCVVSCSDTFVDSPNDPILPIDSSGFAIVGATPDTLYYGEQAWIDVNDLGTDTGDLRLFVHTVEVDQMTIVGKRLLYTVPRNAPTGKLRLYKGDSLAKNTFTLHVLPHHVDEFATVISGYNPHAAYPGETITLFVYDLPLRRREFDVLLNDQKLKILEWTQLSEPNFWSIVAEIPESQAVGLQQLQLRAFNSLFDFGYFEVLEHTGNFFVEDRLRATYIEVSSLLGLMITETTADDSTSIIRSSPINLQANTLLETGANAQRNDSLYFKASEQTQQGDRMVDIALLPASGRNTVSGRVTVRSRSALGISDTLEETATVILNNMLWKREEGYYLLYARGKSVAEKVTSVSYTSLYTMNGLQKWSSKVTTEYKGADAQSVFTIYLVP